MTASKGCLTCSQVGAEKIFYVPVGCTNPRQHGLLCRECFDIGVRCGAIGIYFYNPPTFATPVENCLVDPKSLALIQNLRKAGREVSIVPRPSAEADDALGVPKSWRESR